LKKPERKGMQNERRKKAAWGDARIVMTAHQELIADLLKKGFSCRRILRDHPEIHVNYDAAARFIRVNGLRPKRAKNPDKQPEKTRTDITEIKTESPVIKRPAVPTFKYDPTSKREDLI
jgi:hypothetical protein